MPLYQSLGLSTGTEKYAVVLDIGTAYTKIGFAGESSPRAVIPTVLTLRGKKDEAVLSEISEESKLDRKELTRKLKSFLHHIYFKYLQINPKDRRVILCESPVNLTELRETLADVLFTYFEVPSILFAPHHLLACFTVAVNTALVLDCSELESSVLPVIEATPIIWGWHSGPLGSHAIHESILTLIRAGGFLRSAAGKPCKLTEDLSNHIIEDIKVKSCFVAGYERAKEIQQYRLAQWRAAAESQGDGPQEITEKRPPPPPDMVYPIGGNKLLLVPGLVREEATEVLFEQDNDRLSIATLMLDSLLKCPIDSRKELARNVIVIGGTSMLPGFQHRLFSELRVLVAEEERYQQLTECEFKLHKLPTHPNLASWLGAAIYGSLEIFQQKSVTKEYFIQHNKRLPDWCVLDLKPPERIPERPSNLFTGMKGLSSFSPKSSGGQLSTTRTSTSSSLSGLRISDSQMKQGEEK